ncbi:NAD dependent epimerase dehydratase family protein [Apiospora arundinis]|uniref:NAD dependent epimerase dehydratase family protein n=1 Tax=Apiospora arundinis TaxID=335852 RepID=A0ABR2IR83_9PEZI
MSHNILITGGSGYLGGTLLARWAAADLPPYGKLYALVRTEQQAEAVKQQYGAEPLTFNPYDEAAVFRGVVDNQITVIYHLIDAFKSDSQVYMIKALAEVKRTTGQTVHFLHTSGAKIFSNHAGAPHDRELRDNDPELYKTQKQQKAPHALMQTPVETNNTVIEQCELHGVKSYIFVPCIVYGKGEGFGNIISIQTVAIVKAAKALRRVYRTDEGRPTWPVCHVLDNTNLYLDITRRILKGDDSLGSGRNGYYLAASGSVAWDDLYAAMAAALAKRDDSIIDDARIEKADGAALEKMGKALGCPAELVSLHLGGNCTFTAKHGEEIGWKPNHKPGHILEAAEDEVALILENLKE